MRDYSLSGPESTTPNTDLAEFSLLYVVWLQAIASKIPGRTRHEEECESFIYKANHDEHYYFPMRYLIYAIPHYFTKEFNIHNNDSAILGLTQQLLQNRIRALSSDIVEQIVLWTARSLLV